MFTFVIDEEVRTVTRGTVLFTSLGAGQTRGMTVITDILFVLVVDFEISISSAFWYASTFVDIPVVFTFQAAFEVVTFQTVVGAGLAKIVRLVLVLVDTTIGNTFLLLQEGFTNTRGTVLFQGFVTFSTAFVTR